ncbi:MAG: hypothetical protein GXY36_04955 [Chloroflexi bacterium]|nr:hypothetical protein [Chloroflexota bacterium]
MASNLHHAVQLAQAGSRDEARQLLRQIVQNEPNNEMAWLWLASVAADQTEYIRALREVLRINPTNQQARDHLADFEREFGTQPPATPPYITPTAAPAPAYRPRPEAPRPAYVEPAYAEPRYAEPVYTGKPAPERAARSRPGCLGCGGCGCIQSCLLMVMIFVILPVVACGVLSYLPNSLGPADIPAVYLPGELGRKLVEFDLSDNTHVSVVVPRSWYPAVQGSGWWEIWSDGLEELVPFDSPDTSWIGQDVNLGVATAARANVPILETNPVALTEGGAPSILLFEQVISAGDLGVESFACDDLRADEQAIQARLGPDGANGSLQLIEAGSGLCTLRIDSTRTIEPIPVFTGYDPPAALQTIVFVVPNGIDTGAQWTLTLPEKQYQTYESDIARIIESASVDQR